MRTSGKSAEVADDARGSTRFHRFIRYRGAEGGNYCRAGVFEKCTFIRILKCKSTCHGRGRERGGGGVFLGKGEMNTWMTNDVRRS